MNIELSIGIKKLLFCLVVILVSSPSFAQTKMITLEECYRLAQANYPLIKKQDLIISSQNYSIANISKLYLPQFSVSGQVTYQSETIGFPAALSSVPGIDLPEMSKDQYRIQGEVSQLLFDGGSTGKQKEAIKANAAIQKKQVEIDLYSLKERINQLYFSILLLDGQLKQNELVKEDLENAVDKMTVALKNGTAFRSNVNELKAELSGVESVSIELKANRDAYLKMLSVFTAVSITDSAQLIEPSTTSIVTEINRPELALFDLRKKAYNIQERQLKSDYLPKISAFFQGAYGKPTLNIIEDKTGFWYIGGVRLNWSFGSLYSLGNDRKILNLDRQSLQVERETFLFNTNLLLEQENVEVEKYTDLIVEDDKAIALRASVKESAKAQLDNGVITVRDFISQLNAENLARQNKIIHKIQLLQTIYNLKNISGN